MSQSLLHQGISSFCNLYHPINIVRIWQSQSLLHQGISSFYQERGAQPGAEGAGVSIPSSSGHLFVRVGNFGTFYRNGYKQKSQSLLPQGRSSFLIRLNVVLPLDGGESQSLLHQGSSSFWLWDSRHSPAR